MTGPGDQIAAGRGHLRASHADREQAIGVLTAAFVQGMLDKDEFDLRLGQTMASRTYTDLAALTADLPAGLAAAQPPQPARERGEARVPRLGRVLAVATVLYAGVWPVAFVLPRDSEGEPQAGLGLVTITTLCYVMFSLMFGAQILSGWLDKRSGRQPPRGPGPGLGGQASQHPPTASSGGQVPPTDPGTRHTAEAVPSRRTPPAVVQLAATSR